jgi:hypothetical protein
MDMTAFMIWFMETLPESADMLEKAPDFAQKFISGH